MTCLGLRLGLRVGLGLGLGLGLVLGPGLGLGLGLVGLGFNPRVTGEVDEARSRVTY